jgi:hypothetical protein
MLCFRIWETTNVVMGHGTWPVTVFVVPWRLKSAGNCNDVYADLWNWTLTSLPEALAGPWSMCVLVSLQFLLHPSVMAPFSYCTIFFVPTTIAPAFPLHDFIIPFISKFILAFSHVPYFYSFTTIYYSLRSYMFLKTSRFQLKTLSFTSSFPNILIIHVQYLPASNPFLIPLRFQIRVLTI